MVSNQPITNLKEAWDRWDQHPADPRAAANMIEACGEAGRALSMPYVTLRSRMQELRRKGFTKAQVIDKMDVLLASTRP